MKIIPLIFLVILSTLFISFSGLAIYNLPPVSGNARDAMVVAMGVAGMAIGLMAVKELTKVNKLIVQS